LRRYIIHDTAIILRENVYLHLVNTVTTMLVIVLGVLVGSRLRDNHNTFRLPTTGESIASVCTHAIPEVNVAAQRKSRFLGELSLSLFVELEVKIDPARTVLLTATRKGGELMITLFP
jgi:hypothetical protein